MNPETQKSSSEPTVSLLTITPLYCVITDSDEIPLTDQSKIVRYSEARLNFLGEEDRFVQHLRLYTPECLLWNECLVPLKTLASLGDEFLALAAEQGHIQDQAVLRYRVEHTPAIIPYMNRRATEIIALQLFRRGRLVVGESLLFFAEPFNIRILARLTEMAVDYQLLQQYAPHYEFNCADLRNYLIFYIRLLELTVAASKYPEVDLAITRYCRETSQHGDVVDLMIALEALLVPEEEGIAFKLSQRVANLLGPDAASRKHLFQKIKDFYGLRSKIVHGAKTKSKDLRVEVELDELREITRRVILSVLALTEEIKLGAGFAALLNEMCLDDDIRRTTQEKASLLLK
jgi:hypothetical protein